MAKELKMTMQEEKALYFIRNVSAVLDKQYDITYKLAEHIESLYREIEAIYRTMAVLADKVKELEGK
jgi:NAD-dependent DNA ligase